MKAVLARAAADARILCAAAADARGFHWAACTDPDAMDPSTRNVTAAHSFLANIDEPLT